LDLQTTKTTFSKREQVTKVCFWLQNRKQNRGLKNFAQSFLCLQFLEFILSLFNKNAGGEKQQPQQPKLKQRLREKVIEERCKRKRHFQCL